MPFLSCRAALVPPVLLLLVCLFFLQPQPSCAAAAETCTTEGFKPFPLTTKAGAPLHARLQDWLQRSVSGPESIQTSQHPRVRAWRDEIRSGGQADKRKLLAHVNRVTNKHVIYRTDYAINRHRDYWHTPHDTLTQGGDCEDIALLKAAELYYRGWPTENMYLLVGHTIYKSRRIAHAVLVVRLEGEYLVLDNLQRDVLPYRQAQLEPAYALNAKEAMIFYRPQMQTAAP